MHVRPLRPFFDIWQNALQRLGQNGDSRASPGIALLTPGNGSRHWFEHMMLSRELSCALVEGGDLSVRAGGVFLKTLKGLQPVDVLLRRLDGNMVDPLELDAGSLIGVPGLMEAARAGTVRITNDPGAGAAEAPALAAWLGPMCLRLLGEPLKLASVPTMWLGDSKAEELVRRNPERWLIRSATDGRGTGSMPARLSPQERAALLEAVAAAPGRYAATAALPPSVTPCAGPAGLVPKPVVLRLYLIFDGRSWRAMEGGLARVLEDDEPISGALPGEGMSKDVWVLYQERTDIVGPSIVSVPPLAIRRAAGELPSRVADDLFWLGRYVERLEGSARLVRATIARLSRAALAPHEMLELTALSYSLEHAGVIPPETVGTGGSGNALPEAMFASLRDGGAIAGLFGNVARLTELVRDRLTGDMYAAFTAALRQTRTDAARVNRDLDALSHAMVGILRFSASVAGLAAENMVRGGGWLFLELGRRIERAQAVAAQVGFALDQPPPRVEAVLRLILELCDSVITYRSRYLTVLQPAPVLDLVLADDSNPRGLAFQLASIGRLLDDIAGQRDGFMSGAAAALCAETQALVTRVVEAPDQAAAAADLPVQLAEIEAAVAALSDRVSRHYFALLPVAQTLGLGGEDVDQRGVA
jgi:uncharacterized alpha-E superfamily protein